MISKKRNTILQLRKTNKVLQLWKLKMLPKTNKVLQLRKTDMLPKTNKVLQLRKTFDTKKMMR
jgi:hypothetical protein